MNSEKQKTVLIRSADGSKMIELTPEDLQEYSQCLESKRFNNQLISLVGGIGTTVAIPVKATSPLMYYAKKGAAGIFAMGVISVFAEVGSAISCGPILQQILNSKKTNVTGPPTQFEEKDEPTSKELLDFTPNISSHDFSSPINFSSDTSGLDRVLDIRDNSQELRDKTTAAKKRVTYDDLWRLHKENSQPRNKGKDYSSEGTDMERTTENEPNMEKKKIRTNKYGDPLE